MPKNQGPAEDTGRAAKRAKGAPALSRGAKPEAITIAPNTSQLSQAGVLSMGSMGQSVASSSLLPASAPASSLLPAIPAFQQALKPQVNPNQLHAQLALLLQSGALGQAAATGISNQLTVGSGFPSLATAQQPANPLIPAMAPLLANQVTSYAASRNVAHELLPHQVHGLSYAQLMKHVTLLQQLKQPIPQSLSIAAAEARRKEERKTAKRVANRKSASSSRARKKALVQEMTELNMRLKRQALILALLPDLVIAVDVEGVITFCSEQAERLLQHSPDSLLGAKLTDLLIPSSKGRFLNLVKKLVDGSKDAATDAAVMDDKGRKQGHQVSVESTLKVGENESSSALANLSAEASSVAAVSSDPSFPLAVVKVAAASKGASEENENSDTSASRDSKQPSSLTTTGSVLRSPSASLAHSGSDDGQKPAAATGANKKKKKGKLPSSDTSNTSSLSVDAESNKLQSANANLERNVRLHNKKMKGGPLGADFTDDVIGEMVTANNATARLSSLRVPKGQEGSSSEEDSGYRESNDSREETSSSSASDTSETNGRRKPMAPTCNICLIRNDLTTVWCEVTSSIRTRQPDEGKSIIDLDNSQGELSVTEEEPARAPVSAATKELLLCLRPIRDGDEKVDEKLRLRYGEKREVSEEDYGNSSGDGDVVQNSTWSGTPPHPPNKRKGVEKGKGPSKRRQAEATGKGGEVDTDVAESLMMMSSKN